MTVPRQRLTVDDIPEECLELIFQRLALSVSRSNSLESPSPQARISAYLTVSKNWRGPAERTLQRYVRLSSARQSIAYCELIKRDPLARQRLVRLDALNENGGIFADGEDQSGAKALLEILARCQKIRHLKVGLLHISTGPLLAAALRQQRHLRYFIMQNGVGHRQHLHMSWEEIADIARTSWPYLRSLDVFGTCSTSLAPRSATLMPALLPTSLTTIFLADSPALDHELDTLLSLVPTGLRELGLSWCTRLTPTGIIALLRKYGSTLRLLTLVAGPSYRSPLLEKAASDNTVVLDQAIKFCPRLQILDAEGPWATDAMLPQVPPSLKAMVIGKCPRITSTGLAGALDDPEQLKGLQRLGVVLETDLSMLFGKKDKVAVKEACQRRGVRFETTWTWDEAELAHALDRDD